MAIELMNEPVRTEESLRPGTQRFGLRVLARLAGGRDRGVDLGADPNRGDLAAMKFAMVDQPLDPDALTRLGHEHSNLRMLDHPTIRRSFGVRRERQGLRTRSAALLLAFVDGSPLDLWQAADLPTICRTMSEVCRGLAHVHERGLVHGDLRPRHVLVEDSGRPTLISFGRAVRSGVRFDASGIDRTFASPEQVDGGVATPRADVFGVAATMAAVLLRQPLEPCRDGARPCDRKQQHEAWARSLEEAGIHPPLRRLLVRSLEPDPLRRPAFIEALASGLGDLADTLSKRRAAA